MKSGLSKNVPFFPWNQLKYFERLNFFANSYASGIKREKGIDLGHIDVKPLLDMNKDNYWGNLIEMARGLDESSLPVKVKNNLFRKGAMMQAVIYPFGALGIHAMNHISSEIEEEFTDTTIYVPTGLASRMDGNFNTEKITKEITSTLDSWSNRPGWSK